MGVLTLTNSTLSFNQGGGSFGGGLYVGGTSTVTNSTFYGNFAFGGGGIYSQNDGTLTITNSTFAGNNAGGGFAGAIEAAGTLTIRNNIFANSTPSNCAFLTTTVNDNGGNLAGRPQVRTAPISPAIRTSARSRTTVGRRRPWRSGRGVLL